MTLTWLGRAFLYVAFAGAVGGMLTQVRAVFTKKKAPALLFALWSLLGVLGAVGVIDVYKRQGLVKPASLAMSSIVVDWKPRSAKIFLATPKRSSRRSPCWGRSSVITTSRH